jgi:dienelactone hydrolase
MARAAPARVHTPVPRGRISWVGGLARGPGGGGPAARAGARDPGDTGEATSSSAPPALPASGLGRREALGTAAALTAGLLSAPAFEARAEDDSKPSTSRPSADYTARGPYGVKRLPKLEHTCVSCFPRCVGDACLLSIDAYVPTPPPVLPDAMFPLVGAVSGDGDVPGDAPRARGPYPLAVFTAGFLVDAEQYASYARRLCSWGYVVLQYNKRENVAGNALDDVVSAAMIRDLIGWAQSDVLLGQLVDTAGDDKNAGVYLVGHSRGGKISALEAVEDPRVRAACLLDPVDNTVYAPLGAGFPSALAAMRERGDGGPPLVVVGGERGGDCAPGGANYLDFARAASGDSWGVEIAGAGHFQFLDNATFVQRAVCEEGRASESEVRGVSQALMVAHAETVFRGAARDAALRDTLRRLEDEFGDASGRKTENAPWTVLRGLT